MSELTNRRHSGTFYQFGHYGEMEEGQTLSCCHCQNTWVIVKGSGKQRGFCFECMGYVCGPSCQECIPYEVRMENIEAGRPELTPRPIKILVPPGEIFGG